LLYQLKTVGGGVDDIDTTVIIDITRIHIILYNITAIIINPPLFYASSINNITIITIPLELLLLLLLLLVTTLFVTLLLNINLALLIPLSYTSSVTRGV